MQVIDVDALLEAAREQNLEGVESLVADLFPVEAVSVDDYNELRDNFVEYVCAGVTNPAPYCKNRRASCVDGHGWCMSQFRSCRGFDPGERREDDR